MKQAEGGVVRGVEILTGKETVWQKNLRYLEPFWLKFKRSNCEGRIFLLKKMSEILIKKRNSRKIGARRSRFDKNKHWYFNRKLCQVCYQSARARHHILLIKNGGGNHNMNLIGLCQPCHKAIHPWIK